MAEDTSGLIVASLVATGIGIFIVDKAMSPPGESWFDKLVGRHPEEGSSPEGAGPVERVPSVSPAFRKPPPEAAPPGFFEQLASFLHPAPPRGAAATPRVPPARKPPTGPPAGPPVGLVAEAQTLLNLLPLATLQGKGLIPRDVRLPLAVDGILGKDTARVLAAAQSQMLGMPATGRPDVATLAALSKRISAAEKTPPVEPRALPVEPPVQYYRAPSPGDYARLAPPASSGGPTLCPPGTYFEPRLQACIPFSHRTGVDAGDWKAETAQLGGPAQDVIQHALDQETNPRTLLGLAHALDAANFPITAAAVKAKSPSAKVGFFSDEQCLPCSADLERVGWPEGYGGGPSFGSCPPGTRPECLPPPAQLTPLTGFGGTIIGAPQAGYEGGPFVMSCPPGNRPECMPPPATLVPLTGFDGEAIEGW
ncbi:MAG TPA: peptidoglycan-binding domain-containing protein [Thermoanaerobaculia bacterium]|nr:peptidoglycan-binding domain-containing protein [Thermoanaerobaculia bacterium]